MKTQIKETPIIYRRHFFDNSMMSVRFSALPSQRVIASKQISNLSSIAGLRMERILIDGEKFSILYKRIDATRKWKEYIKMIDDVVLDEFFSISLEELISEFQSA
jgi:hypothetical protein